MRVVFLGPEEIESLGELRRRVEENHVSLAFHLRMARGDEEPVGMKTSGLGRRPTEPGVVE